MQPATLFPLVLLLALPAGMLLFKLILEIAAGVATYCLLRQLGLTRYVALFGGLLYSVNGSFAWLAGSPANPIPFLPLLVLGVERARAAAVSGRKAGWMWIAVALALSLYAGFPEVAYINGLLAMVWAVLRFLQMSIGPRTAYVRKLLAGG